MGLQRRGRARLNLAAAHLAELVAELAPLCQRASVRDVHALPPADLLLVLEPPGGGRILRLRISADPNAPRVHLQHERVPLHAGPLGPFFRRLAAELAGAELVGLSQVRGDRILLLEFRGGSSGERRALLAELVGRHSNLVWLGQSDRVLELLVPAESTRKEPRLSVGNPWVPPPGAGPRGTPPPPLAQAFPAPEREPSGCAGLAPLSWVVESSLGAQAAEAQLEQQRRQLAERVARKLDKARGLLAGLERRLEASGEAERVREEGELLKANLARVERGARELVVEDFFAEGAPRRLPLDPKLSPRENLERCFERARKLERGRAALDSELALARERVRDLEELQREAASNAEPAALDARAVAAGLLDPRQEADPRRRAAAVEPRLPFRSFAAASGAEIRVGRSAADNDQLSFRHARGNDVWLHTADAPGSHVVLRLEGKGEPDPEDLLDAAHLALHFSPLRGATRARLHVARCKEVHKPRGAKAGLVQLSGGKTWEIRVQPERLQRLLGSRRGAAPDPEGAGS